MHPSPAGGEIDGPIALIEVQGYLAAALSAARELSYLFDEPLGPGQDAHQVVAMLGNAFFPDGKPALALDGAGNPIAAVASNPWAFALGRQLFGDAGPRRRR